MLAAHTIPAFVHPADEPPAASTLASLELTRCASRPAVDGCAQYGTPRGNSVLVCAVAIDVPPMYGPNLVSSRDVRFSTFCGKGTTGEYLVANKWYVARGAPDLF